MLSHRLVLSYRYVLTGQYSIYLKSLNYLPAPNPGHNTQNFDLSRKLKRFGHPGPFNYQSLVGLDWAWGDLQSTSLHYSSLHYTCWHLSSDFYKHLNL